MWLFCDRSEIFDYYMSKGRTENSVVLEQKVPVYLDSAYKHLLHQEHIASSLKNRAKVLQLNQNRLLKQIQNSQNKWMHLEGVRENHSTDIKKLKKDRQVKDQEMQRQKLQNNKQRQNHQRQMSMLALEKAQQIERVKKEALMIRRENHKLIQKNRQNEIQSKKQIRNKIHEDIAQSRTTIKNFFTQKHQQIVETNTQEVRNLNLKRANKELQTMSSAGKEVKSMEDEIKLLRQTLHLNRNAAAYEKRDSSKVTPKLQQENKHPLVRRIESMMNKYNKFL